MRKMKELVPMNEYGIFVDMKDTTLLDSRFVATTFHKNHNTVLRDIRELDCSESFRLSNFVQSSYTNQQGKQMPCYAMTRDGFIFLVMGYRGKKAAAFKEEYIARFNKMEAFIAELVAARMECPALTANIKKLHEHPKAYHYSNEFDMINRIALGMPAKQFRRMHGIPDGEPLRPYLTEKEVSDIKKLQNADVGLTLAVPDFQERKQILMRYKAETLDAAQTEVAEA